MEKLIGEYNYIEIPESFNKGAYISNGFIYCGPSSIRVPLPPGNYELIGMSDDLNDEQIKEIIVEQTLNHYTGQLMGWKNYGEGWEYLDTRHESFQSLLTSKGLKGRYAILKTKKGI